MQTVAGERAVQDASGHNPWSRPKVESVETDRAITQAYPTHPLATLVLTVIETREGLATLETEWNDLFARVGQSIHVFQTYPWARHWADHFLPGTSVRPKLAVVTGRLEGRLVMLWPLVVNRIAGLKEIAWLGEPVSQYGDVLAIDGPHRQALIRAGWQFIAKTLRPDVVRLNKTREDAVIAPLLGELGACPTQTLNAPYLNLSSAPDWSTYEKRFAPKALKNRRRQYRRLEEMGPVSFVHFGVGPDASRMAHEAIQLKRAWLRDKGLVSPALSDDRTLAFFEAAASDTLGLTGVKVSALMCGAQTVAIAVGFTCRDRLAIHILVYSAAYEKAAAGALLLERSMSHAHEQGFAVYDLLAPGGGYKSEWADASVVVTDYAVPLTPLGRLYVNAYLQHLRPRLKAVIEKALGWRRKFNRWTTRYTSN